VRLRVEEWTGREGGRGPDRRGIARAAWERPVSAHPWRKRGKGG
jgi:hypothetical protein